MSPAGTGGQAGSIGDDAAGPSVAVPLPTSAFVFSRRAKPGSSIEHLYTFDVTTKTERLLTTLEDSTEVLGCAISPDRRRVAFGTRGFRASADETLYKRGAIWSVGSEGKSFERLSPVWTDTEKTTSIWSSDPLWRKDGSSLFYSHTVIAKCDKSVLCATTGLAELKDGSPTRLELGGCDVTAPVALHPGGERLLVKRSGCVGGGGTDGLHEWTTQPLAASGPVVVHPRPVMPTTSDEDWKPEGEAAWLPDGSGVVFIVEGTWRGVGKGFRHRLALWQSATQQVKTVYEPSIEDARLSGLAIGPSSEVLAVIDEASGESRKTDVYQVDLSNGTTKALTQSGTSRAPCW